MPWGSGVAHNHSRTQDVRPVDETVPRPLQSRRQIVLLTAILGVAALLLSLDVFVINHRINRGIHAGFLVRPSIHGLRGVALAAVLIPALAR